jgi:hypothetical protein
VIILDAGNPGPNIDFEHEKSFEDNLRKILQACHNIDYSEKKTGEMSSPFSTNQFWLVILAWTQ